MNNAAILWHSKKQTGIATSSTEAEYVALTVTMKKMMYAKNLLTEFNIPTNSMTIFGDNTSALRIADTNEYSDRTMQLLFRNFELADDTFRCLVCCFRCHSHPDVY